MAEGGFGSVHRGTLPDGQIIAVKQYKIASTQGDKEFCSEVEVLSCAQHRNVVMLIGLCVEDGKRLLVYEYICYGSLHSHLYGKSFLLLVTFLFFLFCKVSNKGKFYRFGERAVRMVSAAKDCGWSSSWVEIPS